MVAALDVYHPRPGHEDEDGPEFDWEHAGNLFDERIVTFFENDTREYVVEKVQAGHAGAVRLLLQAEFWLEVCPVILGRASIGACLNLAPLGTTSWSPVPE